MAKLFEGQLGNSFLADDQIATQTNLANLFQSAMQAAGMMPRFQAQGTLGQTKSASATHALLCCHSVHCHWHVHLTEGPNCNKLWRAEGNCL